MPFLFLQAVSFHSYKMKIYKQTSCNLLSFPVQLSVLFQDGKQVSCPHVATSQIYPDSRFLAVKQQCQFSP